MGWVKWEKIFFTFHLIAQNADVKFWEFHVSVSSGFTNDWTLELKRHEGYTQKKKKKWLSAARFKIQLEARLV